FERSEHRTRHCDRILLLDAAHHHTKMLRLNNNGHANRLDPLVDRFRNLHREPLLYLKALRKHIDNTRKLAEADDLSPWQVADVAFSEEWQKVMFAEAEHFDVLD